MGGFLMISVARTNKKILNYKFKFEPDYTTYRLRCNMKLA